MCTGASPELVPKGFEVDVLATEWAAAALEWMGQKDSLGQDFFLLGSHGPMRRWLALVYCARANREVEYLAPTQDTTEPDLKHRRTGMPFGHYGQCKAGWPPLAWATGQWLSDC